MNPDPESVRFLHLVTGTQIKVLLALKLLGNRASIVDIAAIANCHRNAASGSLHALAAIGYTESADRYHWQLSTACMQLPLWTPTELSTELSTGTVDNSRTSLRDAHFMCIPCSSSSSSSKLTREEKLLLLPRPDAQKQCVPPELPAATDLLRQRTALTDAVIQSTLQAAIAAGLPAADLPQIIQDWLTYCHTRPTINNPDGYTAARLTAGRRPPADTTRSNINPESMTATERLDYYVPKDYQHLIKH